MLKQGKNLTDYVPFFYYLFITKGTEKTILIILMICGRQIIMLHCGYSVLKYAVDFADL